MMLMISDMHVRYITDENSDKSEVIVPIEEFENLLEDLNDLAIVAERREEETVSHEDIKKELKDDVLI
jgi:hypothetical protein